MLSWLIFLMVFWTIGTLVLSWTINHIALKDIREFNAQLDRNLRAVELERLKRLPRKSRITNKPDL